MGAMMIAPLAQFSIQNREKLTDRMERTAVWKKAGGPESPATLILGSTQATLGMFTYEGDAVPKHNVSGEPMLSPFISSFFLLGLVICVANIRKPFSLFLLSYLILSLVPGFLTVQAPQSSRTLGAAAPAMLLSAVGMLGALEILIRSGVRLVRPLAMIILSGAAFTGANDGLLRYGHGLDALSHRDSSVGGLDRDQYRAAMLLNQLGDRIEVFLSPQLFLHATVEYLTYEKSQHRMYTPLTNFTEMEGNDKLALVVLQNHQMNLWWLRDEEGKRFFKWWHQRHGIPEKGARLRVRQTYRSYPSTTRATDLPMLEILRARHPSGRTLTFDSFTVFIAGPIRSSPPAW